VLYIGVTNNLSRRVSEHNEIDLASKSFTKRYKCYNLVYFERFSNINLAIKREKEIKGWTRLKKEQLIAILNPSWEFIDYMNIQ
jgi:putative endonuclease